MVLSLSLVRARARPVIKISAMHIFVVLEGRELVRPVWQTGRQSIGVNYVQIELSYLSFPSRAFDRLSIQLY